MPISQTLKDRRRWREAAVGLAIGGVGMGLMGNFATAALGGMVVLSATAAFVLHRRLGDHSLRTRAARASRVRAELASWIAALLFATTLIALALHTLAPRTITVSGKPVEVRSEARLVIMPDGRAYRFWCGSHKSQGFNCPALAKWRALPRWPEPEHVEMQVSGEAIRDLRMDGETIVDSRVDNTDWGTRVGMGLAGGVLAVVAIRAIWRRSRKLIELRRPSCRKSAGSVA